MKTILWLSIIILPRLLLAATNCEHTDTDLNCVEYVKNYDGDTITVNIPGVISLFGYHMKVRIDGIDTPEIRSQNKCEKELAYITKRKVQSLLEKAKSIQLRGVKRGKYFRIVAQVLADDMDIGKYLIEHNLAVSYDGGTKNTVNWCHYLDKIE